MSIKKIKYKNRRIKKIKSLVILQKYTKNFCEIKIRKIKKKKGIIDTKSFQLKLKGVKIRIILQSKMADAKTTRSWVWISVQSKNVLH